MENNSLTTHMVVGVINEVSVTGNFNRLDDHHHHHDDELLIMTVTDIFVYFNFLISSTIRWWTIDQYKFGKINFSCFCYFSNKTIHSMPWQRPGKWGRRNQFNSGLSNLNMLPYLIQRASVGQKAVCNPVICLNIFYFILKSCHDVLFANIISITNSTSGVQNCRISNFRLNNQTPIWSEKIFHIFSQQNCHSSQWCDTVCYNLLRHCYKLFVV